MVDVVRVFQHGSATAKTSERVNAEPRVRSESAPLRKSKRAWPQTGSARGHDRVRRGKRAIKASAGLRGTHTPPPWCPCLWAGSWSCPAFMRPPAGAGTNASKTTWPAPLRRPRALRPSPAAAYAPRSIPLAVSLSYNQYGGGYLLMRAVAFPKCSGGVGRFLGGCVSVLGWQWRNWEVAALWKLWGFSGIGLFKGFALYFYFVLQDFRNKNCIVLESRKILQLVFFSRIEISLIYWAMHTCLAFLDIFEIWIWWTQKNRI